MCYNYIIMGHNQKNKVQYSILNRICVMCLLVALYSVTIETLLPFHPKEVIAQGFGQDNSGGGFGQDNSGGGIDQRLEKAFRSLNNDCQQQQQNQEDFSTIPLPPGSKPLSIAFDSEHNKLYATNVKGNTVLIMDVDPEAMEATEREEIIDMVR